MYAFHWHGGSISVSDMEDILSFAGQNNHLIIICSFLQRSRTINVTTSGFCGMKRRPIAGHLEQFLSASETRMFGDILEYIVVCIGAIVESVAPPVPLSSEWPGKKRFTMHHASQISTLTRSRS